MQIILGADKGGPISPGAMKNIADALSKNLKGDGKFEAFIAWAGLPKMRFLNRTWRGKDKPTNVLSYPQFEPDELITAMKQQTQHEVLYLGDIVLCLPYLKTEVKALKIPLNDHIAHLVVHGVLHLLGYDHMISNKADRMEKLERKILAELGVPDPYLEPAKKRKPVKKTVAQKTSKKRL